MSLKRYVEPSKARSGSACFATLIPLTVVVPNPLRNIDVDLSPRIGDFTRHQRLFPFGFVVVRHAARPG